MKKAILLIIDGLGDLPTPKTPLQAAKKPNLDRLAKSGITGLLAPVGRFIVPGSDTSHLALLGYDPREFYCGRGPLEALGIGMELREGDVAFRTNFATMENGSITDRRAGRIDTKVSAAISIYLPKRIRDVDFIFKSSVEHRGALIMRGPGLSPLVSGTDPQTAGRIRLCQPLAPEAIKTADLINEFTTQANERLAQAPENQARAKPANALLIRGAGVYRKIRSFQERFRLRAACVAGGALYKGVAKYLGIDVPEVPEATGDGNTDLRAKGNAAIKALLDHDFVMLHVKGCDSAGHDGDFIAKKKMLERTDKELIPLLMKSGACLVITGDHSTPVSRKAHSGHEVPLLVHAKGERSDNVKKFDEMGCMQGGLGHIQGKDVMPLILNLMEKGEKYGS